MWVWCVWECIMCMGWVSSCACGVSRNRRKVLGGSLSLYTLFLWGMASPWIWSLHWVFSWLEGSKPLFPFPTVLGLQTFLGTWLAVMWVLRYEPRPLLFTAETSLWLLFLVLCLQKLRLGSVHDTQFLCWLNWTILKGHSYSHRQFRGRPLNPHDRNCKGQVCSLHWLSYRHTGYTQCPTGSRWEWPPGAETPTSLAFTVSLISPARGSSWANVCGLWLRSDYLQPLLGYPVLVPCMSANSIPSYKAFPSTLVAGYHTLYCIQLAFKVRPSLIFFFEILIQMLFFSRKAVRSYQAKIL